MAFLPTSYPDYYYYSKTKSLFAPSLNNSFNVPSRFLDAEAEEEIENRIKKRKRKGDVSKEQFRSLSKHDPPARLPSELMYELSTRVGGISPSALYSPSFEHRPIDLSTARTGRGGKFADNLAINDSPR